MTRPPNRPVPAHRRKLSDDAVRYIRKAHGEGALVREIVTELVSLFGIRVSTATVDGVLHKGNYSHVPDLEEKGDERGNVDRNS